MSILVDSSTRVICQGITGSAGAFHTKACLDYGTRMVGGVTPGKGATKDPNGLPIFDTVDQAVRETGAEATMVFVPAPFAADAILEAADAGIRVIVAVTEGIPALDMMRVRAQLDLSNPRKLCLIGPNCPGIISPGPKNDTPARESRRGNLRGCKMGIMPGYIHLAPQDAPTGKAVGIISRSGTLTYEAVWQCTQLGVGQSTCIGIGGDPVRGLNFIDALRLFAQDDETHGVVLIGEIGGSDEEDTAAFIKQHFRKPIAAFIAGRTAPPGRRMGHAGAIISGGEGGAESKIAALRDAGCHIADSPADIGAAMAKALSLS